MYIKAIRLKGFRTYKDEIELKFDPSYNCIVGLNGAGKSNILLAISFIMADFGGPLSERKFFLHEGASSVVNNAFVEVIFDNSDRRLTMFNEKEISIKRSFTSQKDDWLLNGKHITKQELVQLFESAGFSRSNPYFIVRQGKISELTTMDDQNRLKLIKHIAGTKIYEEKRTNSIQFLYETEKRQNRVDENIEIVTQKMEALKNDQKELHEYQQLDRAKRFIEDLLNEITWKESMEAEKNLEAQLREVEKCLTNFDIELTSIINEKEQRHERTQQLQEARHKHNYRHQEYKDQSTEVIGLLKRIELEISEWDENNAHTHKENLQNELLRLREQLKTTLNEIENFENENSNFDNSSETTADSEEDEIAHLYAKQNRNKSYTSKIERNKFLNNEIEIIKTKISHLEQNTHKMQNDYEVCRDECDDIRKTISEIDQKKKNFSSSISYENAQQTSLREKVESTIEQRRVLQRQLNEEMKNNDLLSIQHKDTEEKFWKTFRFSNRRAIKSIEKYIENNSNIFDKSHIYGPIIDNIQVDDEFRLAVEISAHTQLINFVVENAHIASKLIVYLQSSKGGQITITPLNELHTRLEAHTHYPEGDDDIYPLIKCINYPPQLELAINQIWGKTLLVKDENVAHKYIKNKWDCVTLEGDMFTHSGLISGGYTRFHTNRLSLYANMKRLKERLDSSNQKIEQIQSEIKIVEEVLRKSEEEIINCGNNKLSLSAENEQNLNLKIELEGNLHTLIHQTIQLGKSKHELDLELQTQRNRLTILTEELNSPFVCGLSKEEEKKLENLKANLRPNFSNFHQKFFKNFENEIKQQKHTHTRRQLENQLNNCEAKLASLSAAEENETKIGLLDEQKRYKKQLTEIEEAIQKLDEQLSQINAQFEEELNAYDLKAQEEENLNKEILFKASEAEQFKTNIEKHRKQKEEASSRRKALPTSNEQFENYKKMTVENLMKIHTETNEKIAKFSNVNKKAIDQLSLFIDEQEILLKRKQELKDSFNSIIKLIEELDQAKERTLMNTFKKVNTQFGQVFSELIPSGKAKLVLKRVSTKADEEDDENLHTDPTNNQPKLDSIVGINIKASFKGADQTYYSMQQLSGGQKTIVALALIFAIQRCDPAPFYLFDEIDAALDDQYRSSVAITIRKQAQMGIQFIITTFRPQLIEFAEKLFRVSIQNRASLVDEISKEEAYNLVQGTLAIGE